MLHEILLSLSGLPSPIWDQLKDGAHDDSSFKIYTSPPERAMLNSLAELSDIHLKVRSQVTRFSRSHSSPTCRAVINRIATTHLRAFTNEVIQVETAILQGDAQFVGAYKTVSLSTLVARFQPWVRPMRWLYMTVQMLDTQELQTPASQLTGAAMLEYLRKECHTGYTDLKAMSSDLLIAAQKAWLQALMPWILYGQLPSFGTEDFLVSADSTLKAQHVPYFVSNDAAEAILAIGNGLVQFQSHQKSSQNAISLSSIYNSLLNDSLDRVKSLEYPLESNKFMNVIEEINGNVSQEALSHLLSEKSIVELLLVIQEYVLLRNGEFSTSLLKQAAENIHLRTRLDQLNRPVRRAGIVDAIQLSDAEAAVILSKTWSDLAALMSEHQSDDSVTDKAISWLCLKTTSESLPVSTLLPNPSCLSIELSDSSPLRIFITQADLEKYQNLSAYLVSLNRAQAQLTQLWRSSSHRRWYSASQQMGPRKSQEVQRVQRVQKERRDRKMRSHWVSASRALLVLSEISKFLHGDVIEKSWECLWTWLQVDDASRPVSSRGLSRPTTASSRAALPFSAHGLLVSPSPIHSSATVRRDPRILAQVHKKYLDSLYHSVLLDNSEYCSALRSTLNTIDHYVALFHRLQKVWEDLDLHTNEQMVPAFADLPQEEAEVLKEMERTKGMLADQVHELVDSIEKMEKQNSVSNVSNRLAETKLKVREGRMTGEFRAWSVRTLNPLLMKLDFVVHDGEETFEDALLDV